MWAEKPWNKVISILWLCCLCVNVQHHLYSKKVHIIDKRLFLLFKNRERTSKKDLLAHDGWYNTQRSSRWKDLVERMALTHHSPNNCDGVVVLKYYSHLGSTVLILFYIGDSHSPSTATTSIGFTLYMTIHFERCEKILSDNKLRYHKLTIINTHSFLTYRTSRLTKCQPEINIVLFQEEYAFF